MNFVPLKAEPFDIRLNRFDVLGLFFRRVGIVEKQIAHAAVFFGGAEVKAQRFCVPDVQIAVRFGRETGMHYRVHAFGKFFVNDIFDKVIRFHNNSLRILIEYILAHKAKIYNNFMRLYIIKL